MVNAMSKYVDIHKLKNDQDLMFNDVNLGNVIATKVYNISFKRLLRNILHLFLYSYNIQLDAKNERHLIVYSFRKKKSRL